MPSAGLSKSEVRSAEKPQRISLLTSNFKLQTFTWALLALLALPLIFGACARTIDQTIDDATITARVKTALLNDPQIGSTKIDVDSANGVVTLSGRVKSEADATRAIGLARQTADVTDVKSMLQVAPPTPRS